MAEIKPVYCSILVPIFYSQCPILVNLFYVVNTSVVLLFIFLSVYSFSPPIILWYTGGDCEICSGHSLVIENGMYMKVMTMILTWQHLKVTNGYWCNKNKNYMDWEETEKDNLNSVSDTWNHAQLGSVWPLIF